MKRTYKNPISTSMAEYREDFRYNREWWIERMGTGIKSAQLQVNSMRTDNILEFIDIEL